MNWKFLFIGIVIHVFAQMLVFYQLNLQFLNDWVRRNPLLVALFGVPISYLLIKSTHYFYYSFGEILWPQRFVAFALGVIVYGVMLWFQFKEPLTMKTITCLLLSFGIILLQIFWK